MEHSTREGRGCQPAIIDNLLTAEQIHIHIFMSGNGIPK